MFEAVDPQRALHGRARSCGPRRHEPARRQPAAARRRRRRASSRCRWQLRCRCWRTARACTSSAIPAGATSPSPSRTTSCSTTKAHRGQAARSKACAGCTTARRPKEAAPAVPSSTPALGGDRAAPQGRQDRHAASSTARKAPTAPTRGSQSARSGRRWRRVGQAPTPDRKMRVVTADFRGRELNSHAAGPHRPVLQYQAGLLKAIEVERTHRELIAPALDAAGLGGAPPARSSMPATFARTCSA